MRNLIWRVTDFHKKQLLLKEILSILNRNESLAETGKLSCK